MKDGGYSLRKFKRIFKREMEENPHKYIMLNQSSEKVSIETVDEVKEDEVEETKKAKSDEKQVEEDIKEEDPQVVKTKARE